MTTTSFTAWGTLPETTLPVWPGEVRSLGGRDIFVREAGAPDGAPAVFVHGLGGASSNWTDLMALLGDKLHGYALDLPGFGRSAPTASGRYPLAVHVRAVEDLIESLGGPVHLFGNSLGGATATKVAARRPDLIKSLTLVSPALPDLKLRGGLDLRLPLMFVPGIGPRVQAKLAQRSPEEQVMSTMKLVYYDVSRVPDARLREAAEENVRRSGLTHNAAAFIGSLRGLVAAQVVPGAGNLWASAARVAAPTLLIWGRHDKLVNVALSDRALKTFSDSTLLILEDAGHVAQLEQPEAVAAAWRDRFGSLS